MVSNPKKHEIVKNLVDTHLSAGHSIRFWVTSNSMHPFLQVGDAVIAEIASTNEISPGDVLILQRDRDYLTHRLVKKSGSKFFTKGDNNVLPDPSFSVTEITGKVFQIQRSDKIINLLTRKWLTTNRLVAKLSLLEWKAFSIHRFLRLPFRLAIRTLQIMFMNG